MHSKAGKAQKEIGQQLGNAEAYAKAAGYGPNELLQVGFDTSPQVMDGFV